MSELVSILQKTFTKEFYRLNAMFFLITVGVAFGFMRDQEHRALAEFIVSAPVWSSVPTAIWILYSIKVISFNNQVCRMKEMTFIHNLLLAPVSTRLMSVVSVVFNQLLPIVAYGIFLIATAIKNNFIASAISLIVILISLLTVSSFFLFTSIGSTVTETKTSPLKQWIDKNFQKSFVQFYTEWLVRNQPGLLITIKTFGCLIIFAVTQLYKYDQYDFRFLAMGCVVAFGSGLTLVHQFVLFENHAFSLMRNLPLPPARRVIFFLTSIAVVSLPEIILLVRNFPDQLSIRFIPETLIFSFSILLLGYKILLLKGKGFEQFSGETFFTFIFVVVIILFSTPLLLIAAVAIGISLFQYDKAFYRFELLEDNIQPVSKPD